MSPGGGRRSRRDLPDRAESLSANPITAQRYVERVLNRCRKVGNAPHGGRARDDLEPGLRTVPFERRAVIAYVDGGVRITNVFYGGRNYEALYRGQEPADDGDA